MASISPSAAAGRFVIANQQLQALALQPGNSRRFGGAAMRRAADRLCAFIPAATKCEEFVDAMKEVHL